MSQPPQTLAAKLRAAGYLPPEIQLSSDEATDLALQRCGVSNCQRLVAPYSYLCEDCDGETEAMARHFRARELSLRELARTPTLAERVGAILANAWPCISYAFFALCTIVVCALVLIIGCATARASEVPDRIIAAIAQVETGTKWRGFGDVRGTFERGAIGEVGPWQLSPAVLRDLRAYDRRFRIHADPVLAESLTRAWLLRLYGVTGCWSQTCAAYHAGLAGRHRPHARAYAERVYSLASTL